jgi:catechol 2,3-dioxygenase-like lactoylglutathione lyase family enzyme
MLEERDDVAGLRRLAGWALVAGLCVAAAVAIVALLTGSFDDTDWRVVGTSLGFSVFTATGAAGGAIRLRDARWARALGALTAGASAAAFTLLAAGLWTDAGDELWRAFGIAALAALWSAHASLVLRAAHPDDSRAIRWLTAASVIALGVDTSVGMLALLGAFHHIDGEPLARALAALVVLALLSTALPPVLRGLERRAGGRGATALPFSALARVVVLVEDQVAALSFYRDVLGFRVLHDQQARGMRLLHAGPADGAGVWLVPAFSDGDRELVGRQAGDHPLLVLYVHDLDAARDRLARHGVRIFNEREDPDSRSLQFRDAAGNVLIAAELRA